MGTASDSSLLALARPEDIETSPVTGRQYLKATPRNARLVAQAHQEMNATLLRGPVLTDEGRVLRVPSPHFHAQAAKMWKSLGGRFKREGEWDAWYIPSRVGWKEVDRLYRQFYSESIATAASRLAVSNYNLRCQIMRELEERRAK